MSKNEQDQDRWDKYYDNLTRLRRWSLVGVGLSLVSLLLAVVSIWLITSSLMPIEHQTQMRLGRLLIVIAAIIIATYTTFRTTSDLDEVRNAWMYRTCYGMTILRVICATAFDVLNLFPLE